MSKLTRLLDLLAEPPYSREFRMSLPAIAMLEMCPANMTVISASVGFSTAAATGCADALEGKGLVARGALPNDRRQTILHRTRAGDTLLVKILTLLDAPEPDDRAKITLGNVVTKNSGDGKDITL